MYDIHKEKSSASHGFFSLCSLKKPESRKREGTMSNDAYKVEMTVNEKKIGMNAFVKNVMCNIILGIIRTLKNVEDPKEIVIKISSSE